MFGLSFELTAVIGIAFIFIMTTLGSGLVFFVNKPLSKSFNQIFLGFAAGVMVAAAVWSLLIPAMENNANENLANWVPPTVGFLAGAAFLLLVDHLLPHLHLHEDKPEGLKSKFKRTTMLILAVALHNAPEGLAVGLAFGYALKLNDPVLLASAMGIAIGIGIQNFPEGAAISLPLRDYQVSKKKAFFLGSLSGLVEPVFAALGLFMASQMVSIMPWFLGFAAGAMIYVVVEELIPEAQLDTHSHLGTLSFIAGFLLMMVIDGAL
ncbi:MAG TPA: ZIP family metal transporter [Bacilli bacterium]|nr:MAG: Zinc transporter ZupT [Tenericutes bacterium ADurb.BinA124]HNZ50953.1 ZIP family metal transporter [Bacilli bacterium]HPX84316.1 ZIP family metal transporter [Bacilli bacterium]HQC74602.1 ZIP family metal transporter [Bacilli bacterium]